MRKRAPERYVLMTLGFEIILSYIYICTICNKYMCMYMYTFIYMYIKLTKMYHYMLKHHLQLSCMMHDENVNIMFETSRSNNADRSHHQDMLANVSVF